MRDDGETADSSADKPEKKDKAAEPQKRAAEPQKDDAACAWFAVPAATPPNLLLALAPNLAALAPSGEPGGASPLAAESIPALPEVSAGPQADAVPSALPGVPPGVPMAAANGSADPLLSIPAAVTAARPPAGPERAGIPATPALPGPAAIAPEPFPETLPATGVPAAESRTAADRPRPAVRIAALPELPALSSDAREPGSQRVPTSGDALSMPPVLDPAAKGALQAGPNPQPAAPAAAPGRRLAEGAVAAGAPDGWTVTAPDAPRPRFSIPVLEPAMEKQGETATEARPAPSVAPGLAAPQAVRSDPGPPAGLAFAARLTPIGPADPPRSVGSAPVRTAEPGPSPVPLAAAEPGADRAVAQPVSDTAKPAPAREPVGPAQPAAAPRKTPGAPLKSAEPEGARAETAPLPAPSADPSAAAADLRGATPPPAAKPEEPAVAPPTPHAPVSAVSASPEPARSAAHDIQLQVSGPDRRVDVRLTERAGSVEVSVRTPDSRLAGSLRDDLPALAARLEQTGFRAQTWHPGASAAERRMEIAESDSSGAAQRILTENRPAARRPTESKSCRQSTRPNRAIVLPAGSRAVR